MLMSQWPERTLYLGKLTMQTKDTSIIETIYFVLDFFFIAGLRDSLFISGMDVIPIYFG